MSNIIIFISGNKNKFNEINNIIREKGNNRINIIRIKYDLDEIQSMDSNTVIKHKVHQAYKMVNAPVIVEDTSLEIENMNNFPGALIKFYLKSIGVEGISNRDGGSNATAKTTIGYYDGENEYYFVGKLKGKISNSPAGNNGFGWDKIFIPDGMNNKTFAEMTNEEKNTVSMRKKAVLAMLEKLCN